MKKRFLRILSSLLILVMLCSFVSCNLENETQTEAPTESDKESATENQESSGDDELEKKEETHTHSFGEWKLIVEPTCFKEGREQRECACGETEQRSSSEKKTHDFVGEGIIDFCTDCFTVERSVR